MHRGLQPCGLISQKQTANNGPKAFYKHLNSKLYTSHPNVYVLIENILAAHSGTHLHSAPASERSVSGEDESGTQTPVRQIASDTY